MKKCNWKKDAETTSKCELHNTYHLFEPTPVNSVECKCEGLPCIACKLGEHDKHCVTPPETDKTTWEKKKPTKLQRKYWDSLKGVKNEKAPNWRGDKAGKAAVHGWLEVNYGKESICENPLCKGKSKTYDWAKKTEYGYVKDRKAFMRLCRSCHRIYDLTSEKREQAMRNLWWFNGGKYGKK